MKYKIAFRFDGGHKVGLGHVVRCLALAHELEEKESPSILFVMRDYPEGVLWAQRDHYRIQTISEDEADEAYRILEGFKPDLILNDIQYSSEKYMRKIGSLAPTINYDDLGNGRVYADFLIHVTTKPYADMLARTGYYHGPEYLILRKQFFLLREKGFKRQITERAQTVLVLMGGSDPSNLVVKVLKDLEMIHGRLRIIVVIGLGYRSLLDLQELVSQSRHNMTLQFDVDSDDLLKFMLDADIGIGHYGISAYEMASVGLPFVAIAHNDDEFTQGRIGEYGFCLNLGLGRLLRKGDVSCCVNRLIADRNLRRKLSENGMKTIDAKGLVRIANLILGILKGEKPKKE